MNGQEHITEIIENISDRHITEAADIEFITELAKQRKRNFVMRIATVAACFCAAIGAGFAINALYTGRGVTYSDNSSHPSHLPVPDINSLCVIDTVPYEENGGLAFVGEPIQKYGMTGGTLDIYNSSRLYDALLTCAVDDSGYIVFACATLGNFDEEYYSIAQSYVYIYKDGELVTEPFPVGFTVRDRYGVPYPKNSYFEPLKVYSGIYSGIMYPIIAYKQLDPKDEGLDYTFFYIIIDGTPYLIGDVSPVKNSTAPNIFGNIVYGRLRDDNVVIFNKDNITFTMVE
ncbi:MAG: hypothetical protein J1E39_09570 [Eubacterium sp.]|nr:hypothetical protein [Eubacterium sp.]